MAAQATDGKASITPEQRELVAIDRAKGFRDISSYPNMKIVATQTADFRGRGSARNGKHHPGQGSTSPVYAHNDEMALSRLSSQQA